MGVWASQQAKAGSPGRQHVIAGTRGARVPKMAPRVHFVEVSELTKGAPRVQPRVVSVTLHKDRSRAAVIAAAAEEFRATSKVRLPQGICLTGRVIRPEV